MKRYTETIQFQPNKIGKKCIVLDYVYRWVPRPFSKNPLWSRIQGDFDPENFLYPCPPVDLGAVELNGTADTRVLRCPIKVQGDSKIYLPSELKCCEPFVRHVVETERCRTTDEGFLSFHAHITYERGKIKVGKSQRHPAWHVDGFQGVRVPRHQVEHSYIWADSCAAEFCVQPFFLQHLDPTRHNVFHEMAKQAREENVYKGIAGHVYMIDPYIVHRSPVVKKTTVRQIARITFTTTELEDPMNTTNLGIKLAQDYPERLDVRDRLCEYSGEIPWQMYGLNGAIQ